MSCIDYELTKLTHLNSGVLVLQISLSVSTFLESWAEILEE